MTIKNEEEEKAAIQNVVTNNYVTTYSPTSSSSSSSNSPNMLNLQNPVIKVQSGLDSKNECNKTECSVNFIYETSEKVVCLWDF
ncbi:MAG: hypothetical protein LBF15_07030 [Candidatus Peribacteria bacterium]|nr:hypothetical protein [Candidatus Peribacteria bacterium]